MTARGARVLVVDDEADLLDLLRFVLEAEGYAVVTAGDGKQALDAVAGAMPDLILLDMKMPVMDGRQFAREFRRRYGDATPIIVVTAADDARKRALDIGAAGWIAKPFEISDLLRTVSAGVGVRAKNASAVR